MGVDTSLTAILSVTMATALAIAASPPLLHPVDNLVARLMRTKLDGVGKIHPVSKIAETLESMMPF